MILWPLHRFWTFSPLGWTLAVAWNISEIIHAPLPRAGEAFGIIIGCKGKRISK
jgi:hypothetical protein